MNLNKIYYIILSAVLIFSACNESEDIVTGGAREGGLITPTSQSLNYVVGNPEGPYTAELMINQGNEKIETINIYRSFTTTVEWTETIEGEEVEMDSTFVSNEVLDRSIDVTEGTDHFITTSFTFDQLRSELTIPTLEDGTVALPEEDGEYQIGDRWILRVEAVLSDGRVVQQPSPVSVSVSTRYAGTYRPIAADYWRFTGAWDQPVGLSGWPETIIVESVDATTYRVVEWFGPFDGNEFYFQIDPETGVITYPAKTPSGDDQTGNDLPFITCQANAADMPNERSRCNDSNYVINADDTGRDRLVMSFGYMGGNGPRIFYQVLEKIVE